MDRISPVLSFWRDEVGPQGWYRVDRTLDEQIRARFGALWRGGRVSGLHGWAPSAAGALARIIVFDQFPRNMFRGSGESFSTDAQALMAAQDAIARGFDQSFAGPMRQFFYLPYMHAEDLEAQERGIELFAEFLPGDNERHARAHRWVIAEFGRFPWRNADLGRVSSPAEEAFLAQGGYAFALRNN